MFVHLHLHTPFSFLDGASDIEVMVRAAVACGMPALAMTDHNSLAAAVKFVTLCRAYGLRPILGAELTMEDDTHLTLIARDRQGYARLCELLTHANTFGGRLNPHLPWERVWGLESRVESRESRDERRGAGLSTLDSHPPSLICLSGCRRGRIPSLLCAHRYEQALALAARLRDAFGPEGFFMELQEDMTPDSHRVNRELADLADRIGVGVVATNNVHYARPGDFVMHDVLRCISAGVTIAQPHPDRPFNSERYLKTTGEMQQLFAWRPDAVANTLRIAEMCQDPLPMAEEITPSYPLPPAHADAPAYLRHLTYKGANARYKPLDDRTRDRIEFELSVICELGYADYFLMVWEIVRWARKQGIRATGRGSAADSCVAYCLTLTDVDVIQRNLPFARFLVPGKTPDIDIDFPSDKRDDVFRYIISKYGEEHVGMVCTFHTYWGRSAVRDVGKALSIPMEVLDLLSKRLGGFVRANKIEEAFEKYAELRQHISLRERFELLFDLCGRIAGFPRHIGTHSSGIVISRVPLATLAPLQPSARGITQIWTLDKDDAEVVGAIKFDVLSLRALSAVCDAEGEIRGESREPRVESRESRGESREGRGESREGRGEYLIDNSASRARNSEQCALSSLDSQPSILDSRFSTPDSRLSPPDSRLSTPDFRPSPSFRYDRIPMNDEATYRMFRAGAAVGTFQFESAGQMSLAVVLEPRHFEDLVAAVALIRPGPIRGGIVSRFVACRNGWARVDLLHPCLAVALAKTYGCIIFQEQANDVIALMTGCSDAEADKFRKALHKHEKMDTMDQARADFVRRTLAHRPETGEARANLLFDQIEGWSGYGFTEGHAASFALTGYRTAYLSTHYPAQYFAGLMNHQPMGFFNANTLAGEVRRRGVTVMPVDINRSGDKCFTEQQNTLRLGLRMVAELKEEDIELVVAARPPWGYASLLDFCTRAPLHRNRLENLVLAGAFDSLHAHRRGLLWRLDETVALAQTCRARSLEQDGQTALQISSAEALQTPVSEDVQDFSPWDKFLWTWRITGVCADCHVFAYLRERLGAYGVMSTYAAMRQKHGTRVAVAGLNVRPHRPPTRSGNPVLFTLIEDETGLLQATCVDEPLSRCTPVFLTSPTVVVQGIIQRRGQGVTLLVKDVVPLRMQEFDTAQPTRQFSPFQPVKTHALVG